MLLDYMIYDAKVEKTEQNGKENDGYIVEIRCWNTKPQSH